MGDLISKSVLLKCMDERYKEVKDQVLDNLAEGFVQVEKLITQQPTVDAVPVVRCKDCVHWGNKIKHGSFLDVKQCDFHGTRHENSYCSDGEKVQE